MMGDEEKELEQEEKQEMEPVPIEESVSRFAYAVSRIKKHKSETFDLMAEKAIEFYLSKENKDLSGQITHAIQALFYFLAFAIAHPKLTHKLRISLEALNDPKQPNAAKEFAIQVMKDKDVWDQIVNNKTLRPHLVKLGKGAIEGMGLPFPSFKEMERNYINEQKKAGHPNPRYTQSSYIRALMNMEIEGFKERPKMGTPEYKAKREYITGILKDRVAYAKILDDDKVLDTVLTTAQMIMTNDSVNDAILGYIAAAKDVPVATKVMPIVISVLEGVIGVDEEAAAKMAPLFDNLPDIVEKIPAINALVPDFINVKEALSTLLVGQHKEGGANRPIRLATFNTMYQLALMYPGLTKIYDGLQIGSAEANVAIAELIRDGGGETIWVALTAHPTLIPYASKVLEAYFDKNANLTFDERKALYDAANKVPDYTLAMYREAKGADQDNLDRALESPEEKADDIAYYKESLVKTFEERKAEYDTNMKKVTREPVPDYTEEMYKKEQEAAKAAALSAKEYLVVLNDFSQNPGPIDAVIQAVQDLMADNAVSIKVIEALQEPEAAAIKHAKHLVDNMEFPSYEVLESRRLDIYNKLKSELLLEGYEMISKFSYDRESYVKELESMYLPHYSQWAQAQEDAYKAQGLPVMQHTKAMYIEEILDRKKSFLITLSDPDYNLAAARHILATNSIDGLNYAPVEVLPENELLPTLAISLIRTMLNKGINALDPLLVQLPIIANKIPAIQRALPAFIKLEELTEALLGDSAREDAFYLISTIFSHYSRLEKIYAAADPLGELLAFMKTGALDGVLVQLITQPTLMDYIVKVVNDYINAMDMSKPAGNYAGVIVRLLEHSTLWDQIITNSSLRPYIEQIAETYLNKAASMTFKERGIVYDRAHKNDEPAAPAYTQEMFDKDKAAALANTNIYMALLRNKEVIDVVVGVGKFALMGHNQDILNYLTAPKAGEFLPSAFVPIIKALIEGDKLEPLIGKLEVIFRTLAPNNFAPDAPEFGVGIVDKSLLNLIFAVFDPGKKAEIYKLLGVAVGEVNNIVAEFRKKITVDGVEKNVPLFAAITGVVDIISNNKVLKDFVQGNTGTASKIVQYIVRKYFEQYCVKYGIQPKFWGVLDIVLKDLGVVRSLLVGLQEIANGANYKNKDGTFNGKGTERAVDTFVRELVKILNHSVIGPQLRQFIKDNKEIFVSLIDGILNNIPAAKPYITDYVLGLGLTFSDVLDQLVHNPNDIIKLLDMAVDLGVLRGVNTKAGLGLGAGIAMTKKAYNREGLGVYSPVVQQVIAEAAKPYIPQVVVDWTPQWFKNYVPGGTAVGDRRGADFGNWVWRNINITPKEPNTNLHDVLVAKSKADKAVTDEAREFINYNALAKLNFGDEALMLNRYLIEGFSFSGSQASEVYMTNSDVKKSNFKGFEAKEFFINGSKVDGVKFDGSKLGKLVVKEGAVISNTSFKDVKLREFTISDAELINVDFAGLKFEKEVARWFYGKSMVANPDAVLTIRNSTIDAASLASLEAAAKAGGFKLELGTAPVKKEPVVVVPEGEKLWNKCSTECADKIIEHLKTVEFIDFGLDGVEDKDLREFLEGVVQHAFSNMPQENLMYFSQLNMHGLYSVLQNDSIISSLESVYEVDDDENIYVDEEYKVKFTKEVMGIIEGFCSKERGLIEERDKVAPKEAIKPHEERREEQGQGQGIGK